MGQVQGGQDRADTRFYPGGSSSDSDKEDVAMMSDTSATPSSKSSQDPMQAQHANPIIGTQDNNLTLSSQGKLENYDVANWDQNQPRKNSGVDQTTERKIPDSDQTTQMMENIPTEDDKMGESQAIKTHNKDSQEVPAPEPQERPPQTASDGVKQQSNRSRPFPRRLSQASGEIANILDKKFKRPDESSIKIKKSQASGILSVFLEHRPSMKEVAKRLRQDLGWPTDPAEMDEKSGSSSDSESDSSDSDNSDDEGSESESSLRDKLNREKSRTKKANETIANLLKQVNQYRMVLEEEKQLIQSQLKQEREERIELEEKVQAMQVCPIYLMSDMF